MGKRHLTLLLVCLLLFSGGLAWAFLGKFMQAAPGNQSALANADESSATPKGNAPAKHTANRVAVAGSGTGASTNESTDQPPADAVPETQDWVLKGRLASVSINGREVLGLMPLDEIPWSLAYFDFENKEATDVAWASTALGSNGELAGVVARASLSPEVAARAWWAISLDLDQGNPLQDVIEAEPRPDPATCKGLIKPVISGNQIDFGTIRLSFDEPGKETFLLVGRLLGPGDVPLCSLSDYTLQGGPREDSVAEAGCRANSQGRFATFCWLESEDHTDSHPEALDWHLLDNNYFYDEDFERSHDLAAHFRMEPVALAHPKRTGCVLDFGDIPLPGVLLEISCEIAGVASVPPAGDPFLGQGEGLPVTVNMQCGDTDFSTRTAPGMVVRMVVPEGRYRWSAYLENPEYCCAPPSGNIAARAGQLTPLKIVFAPLPLIPVKVLDPQGNQLTDATVNWSIEVNEDDWIEGSAVKGNLVPMLAGKATYVGGLHARFEQASATAEVGATEVTLQFTTDLVVGGALTLILPKLPAEFALAGLAAQLSLESDRMRSYAGEKLYPDKQNKHPFSGIPFTTYTATLKMGGSFGYPDGVLSVLNNIVITAGANLELEFPAIATPPWLIPVGNCTALITVGAEAASLRGPWEYETRTINQQFETGDVVLRAQHVKDGYNGGSGFIPGAFVPGDQRFPTIVDRPTEAWGAATMRLDLPSRLHVRVLRRGQPVDVFTATLADDALGTSCRVQATTGSARLWAPGAKARLVVQLDNSPEVSVDIELAPGEVEHVVELQWVKVVFHQEGENQALWGIAPATDLDAVSVIAVNQESLLAPIKYRIRPQRDLDQSAAFDLDLTDGKDREINLPGIFAAEMVDVVLHMAEADWEGFRFAEFRYWAPSDGIDHPQTADFVDAHREMSSVEMPDALVLRGVPLDRQILLHGVIYRRDSQGRNRPWFIKPISFKAGKENKFTPQWIKGVQLHYEWDEVYCRCISEFPGYWTGLFQDQYVPAGRHEVVILDGDGAELFRSVVEVPASDTEFRIPVDIRARLEQAGLLEPEEPPEPEDS
ncbi:MAG: hypothetical protein IPP14_09260 [Planctomycetes bacterium]|nr:hypothetical protein [Planctomycetota bacterium]